MKRGTVFFGVLIVLAFMSCTKDYGVSRLFDDQTKHFEALRVLGYAASDGAEINEVLMTLENIDANNDNSWYEAWLATAERVEKMAENINDPYSRGLAIGRAFNYYRSAEFFLMHEDQRKEPLSDKMYETFYSSLKLTGVEHYRFTVPFDNSRLDAVYYPSPAGKDKPLIICNNGYDSIQEEMYYLAVRSCLDRGFSVLTFDGPGQGSAIRNRGILMTHEWDKPITAVIDTFNESFGEPKSIVLLGNSLGGCLVVRAAAVEKRIDAIACFDICYDFALAALDGTPSSFTKKILSGEEVPKLYHTINNIMEKSDSGIRWAMAQGRWVFGLDNSIAVLREFSKYTVRDIGGDVTCDVLLLAGSEDHFNPLKFVAEKEKALTAARSIKTVIYDRSTGGQEHCQVGANSLWQADFFSWIEELKL